MDKLSKEESDAMLLRIEELLGARLLSSREAEIFRQGVKYGGYLIFCIKASPRFVIGLAAFLAALAVIKTNGAAIWPWG